MEGQALVARVSTRKPSSPKARPVALVDYGTKRSILRRLAKAGAGVTVFPHSAEPDELERFDGVVLSNGPGDPEPLRQETEAVRGPLGTVPVLGICLGHQLLGLATGHETFKLPFGHRGATTRCSTTRGSGAGDEPEPRLRRRPAESDEATHVSLYDGTVEGFDFPSCERARSSFTRGGPPARRLAHSRALGGGARDPLMPARRDSRA